MNNCESKDAVNRSFGKAETLEAGDKTTELREENETSRTMSEGNEVNAATEKRSEEEEQLATEKRSEEEEQLATEKRSEEEEQLGGPVFVPRLYLQRYYFVQQILVKHKAEKVVDFGSAECKVFRYLLNTATVTSVTLVDIDRQLLEMSKWCIRPMTCDYICRRAKPFTVKIFEGSVTEFDSRLEGVEAVTLIEVIEHLTSDVLDEAVSMVFGKIQPRIVVMTTPNADFNILFPGFSGVRHWDHKFEWTRKEFQEWCLQVAQRYRYNVDFDGIGDPPDGFSHLGSCSQAATFTAREDKPQSIDSSQPPSHIYNLVDEHVYPYQTPRDINEDTVLSEIKFQLRQFQTDSNYIDYNDKCSVPLSTLLRFKLIQTDFTEDTLREHLRNHGYRLSEDGTNIILPAVHKYSDSDSDYTSEEIDLVVQETDNSPGLNLQTSLTAEEYWD